MPSKRPTGLPSRKQILDFIASSDQPAGKREIARAFGLSGQTKIDLKRLLKDMADEGLIDSSPGRAFHQSGGVPKVTVLRVAAVDDGGNVWAVPEQTSPRWMMAATSGRCPNNGMRNPRRRAFGSWKRVVAARSVSATACSPGPKRKGRAGSPIR